jgi:hypothetical protein
MVGDHIARCIIAGYVLMIENVADELSMSFWIDQSSWKLGQGWIWVNQDTGTMTCLIGGTVANVNIRKGLYCWAERRCLGPMAQRINKKVLLCQYSPLRIISVMLKTVRSPHSVAT